MAGVGIQIRERTTLDLGYPLSRHGQGGVRRLRQSGLRQPAGRIDDLAAHEFKVGLRFAFGGGETCCAAMKWGA
jgi:opacity protein-like surface antigen